VAWVLPMPAVGCCCCCQPLTRTTKAYPDRVAATVALSPVLITAAAQPVSYGPVYRAKGPWIMASIAVEGTYNAPVDKPAEACGPGTIRALTQQGCHPWPATTSNGPGLQIRRLRQVVQDCPQVAVVSHDSPGLSRCEGSCLPAWQQSRWFGMHLRLPLSGLA